MIGENPAGQRMATWRPMRVIMKIEGLSQLSRLVGFGAELLNWHDAVEPISSAKVG